MASYFNTIWLFIISLGLQSILALGFHYQYPSLDVSALFGISGSGVFIGSFASIITYAIWKSAKYPKPALYLGAILFQLFCVAHSMYVLVASFGFIPRT